MTQQSDQMINENTSMVNAVTFMARNALKVEGNEGPEQTKAVAHLAAAILQAQAITSLAAALREKEFV